MTINQEITEQLARTLEQTRQAIAESGADLYQPHLSRVRYAVPPSKLAEGVSDPGPPVSPTDPTATLVSSRHGRMRAGGGGELHMPLLDIDHMAHLEPSTQPGHFHLYLDEMILSWDQYERFLRVCADIGLISNGYFRYACKRRETIVRLPGVYKTREELARGDIYRRLL